MSVRGSLIGGTKWIVQFYLAWAFAAGAQAQSPSKTPVVFLPGFAGSYLCERGKETRVWPGRMDPGKLRLPMRSELNEKDLTLEPCGAMREPVRFFGIRVSDVYGKFIDHLKDQLASGVHLHEFSYDWRLSVEDNARKLRDAMNKGKLAGEKVDIVAHSFGGLVARYYIQKLGGEKRVRKLVTMGTPHRGSVDTLETLYEGWGGADAGVIDSAIGHWMSGPAELRKALLTFPGFYDMLPNYQDCCWFDTPSGGSEKRFDIFNRKSWERFPFYKEVFSQPSGGEFLSLQLARSLKFHQDVLERPISGLGNDDYRLIVTGWIDTVTRIYLDGSNGQRLRFKKGPGDGTVPLYSASERRDVGSSSLQYAPGEHMRIFMAESAREAVAHILKGGIAPVGGSRPTMYVKTTDNRSLKVDSLEYAVRPGAVGPGGRLRLEVKLTGEEKLSGADFSNIRARVTTPDGTEAGPIKLKAEPSESGSVMLAATFSAPEKGGAYLVAIGIAGLSEEYKDVFMVLASN